MSPLVVATTALLASGAAAAAIRTTGAQDSKPQDPVLALLAQVDPIDGPVLPQAATATDHAKALRGAAQLNPTFWVHDIHGDHGARHVVFLIPQYHRDDNTPIAWTTLGREIAEVQQHIDTLVRRLVLKHGLACIGTEGSVREKIGRSGDLVQLARWRADLWRGRKAVLRSLGNDSKAAAPHLDRVVELLNGAIEQNASYVDGVGAAQARLDHHARLVRFGIEELQVNQEALALLGQVQDIEEELATLDPQTQTQAAGVVGQMWLREYPAYEKTVVVPLQAAMQSLYSIQLSLRTDGLTSSAHTLAGFLARTGRIRAALIGPDRLAETIGYYRGLDRVAKRHGVEARSLSKAESKKRARLLEKQRRIFARYSEITMHRREQVAATRVIEHMRDLQTNTCALVMGAGHQDGLIAALRAAASAHRLKDLAVIVVTPFETEQ